LGAPHEGGPIAGFIWQIAGAGERGKLRWTDDTQMSLVLAEHLASHSQPDVDLLASEWAAEMQLMRGYGPGPRKLLGRVSAGEDWRTVNRTIWPEGSYGNGAAMRAAPLGLRWSENSDARDRWTNETSIVTHAHPRGVAGAQLIADGVARSLREEGPVDEFLEALAEDCESPPFIEKLRAAVRWGDDSATVSSVYEELGNSVVALESVPTALYIGARFARECDFEGMMRFIIELGGDVDTIGAMAGAIFGARCGVTALPVESLEQLEAKERIESAALKLLDQASK